MFLGARLAQPCARAGMCTAFIPARQTACRASEVMVKKMTRASTNNLGAQTAARARVLMLRAKQR